MRFCFDALGRRRLSFPIPDLGVIDDMAYDAITTAIEHELERGGVYVYCSRAGSGTAGCL